MLKDDKMLHEQAEKAFDPQTYIPLPVGPGTEQIVPLDPIKALNGAGNATNTQPPAQEKKIVEQIAPAAPSKGTANESEGLTNNEVKKGTEKEPKRSVDSDVRAHKLVPPLAHNSGLWESIRSGNEVDEVAWQGEADHLNIHPISSSSRMQQPQSTDVSAAEQRAQSHETSLPADSQSKRRHVSAMNRNALFHVPTVVAQFKPLVPVRRVSLTPFQKKLQQRRALFQMAVAHLKRFNRF
ncbi:unnamed protein product [Anisakis simplex]|uniref:Uncharacterized protein n=1 Tax=Anisakis simplex TaxID=6269 RepID=A0A0M3K1P1_ANISI|nr:unnamed protein product [Anisakis simplex]